MISPSPISLEHMDTVDDDEPLVSGWILQNGDWYPAKSGEHKVVLDQLVQKFGSPRDTGSDRFHTGWIMLQYGMVDDTFTFFATDAQMKTIRHLYELLPDGEQKEFMRNSEKFLAMFREDKQP